MKISVLTATYNRARLIKNLYLSLISNSKYNLEIEWLVMDDGSTDNTEELIKEYQKEKIIEVKYFKQENKGKMVAINNLIKYATGEVIIDCDSDDYFTNGALEIVREEYEKVKYRKDIYGISFLKGDKSLNISGKAFKNTETTMFDLYFKEGEDGEKPIAFIKEVRREYKHELENDEKFITEARMYHKMDEKYKMVCVNKVIMVGEYQEDGYTKNINKQFINNPYGYYKYFQEILGKDTKNVLLKKRIYAIKHYILFSYLTENKNNMKYIKDKTNKILYAMLYIPGRVKSIVYKYKNQ